ncbi:uncharacterized protein LOC110975887 isoform X2 [Acanthaster planci]|uniref:Uncharacterized protein LOC110975887 isoform X2 n=1 Tax=Acanthaster planci TaxID=133434 RepID=A0A8B7XUB9_ACAPL|nr:uncharacterized protein LOC110975887 isoform X2 [Acanthaster planci]
MTMESPDSVLSAINRSLQDGWQAKLNQDGRLFYTDHNNRTSQWIPPPTCWSPKGECLPYGWEEAVDKNGKHYYINHVSCTTTREDPYDVEDIPPVEREVTLVRDKMLGFGFIAGSEKPVVVRSVTEGGPSVGKLLPGDKILRLNGEDVMMKDGPYIIERIRQSSEVIRLTVIQPHIDKTGLKSSFLSANKKQKLKTKPSRVRFADNIKAAAVAPGKSSPSLVYLPSVLKVYLENGQTKSFKYDNKTTVKEVLRNLKEKLALKSMEHFSLVVHSMEDSARFRKFTILQEDETLTQIASRPGSQNWKCLLRVTFAPQDAYDLLSKDPKAFDYFYLQSCNDVIGERFTGDLDSDKAVRLAALQIQQHFLSSKHSGKVSLKALEKEDGVERFLPPSVAKKMKTKELKRLISQHIKQSQGLCTPGQKHLTELQAKLHYLKIVCDLRSFGGAYFTGTMVTDVDSDQLADYNCTVLVGPKWGIAEVISLRDNVTSQLADFSQVTDIQLIPLMVNGDCLRVELHVKNEKPIVLLLTHDDAYDMVTLVNGYYRLFVDNNRSLLPSLYSHSQETEAPAYHSKHRVILAGWNYPNDLASELIRGSEEEGGRSEWDISRIGEGEYLVDLCAGPPAYEEDVNYINRLKSQGRYHPMEAAGGQPDGAVMSFTIYEEGEEEEEGVLHQNANNSLDGSGGISKSDTSTISSSSSWSEKSLDLTRLSDMVEDMFEVKMPDAGEDERPGPPVSRQEMTIDGSDEKVFSETEEDQAGRMEARKPLTKHVDMSDTVALYSPTEEETEGQVRLLHYAIYNDDSLIPVREIHKPLIEDDKHLREAEEEVSSDSCAMSPSPSEENVIGQKTVLMPQDSVLLAHTKKKKTGEGNRETSDIEDHQDSKMESFRNYSSYSNSSVDSDIVDLTHVSFTDSSAGEDSPILQTNPEILPMDLSTVYSGDVSNETDNLQPDIRGTCDSPVPVSIIDLPLPDQNEEETADQAHGIQLAALDAINVSIDQQGELLDRSPHRDPECESDSGNETISSEIIDNGVTDEPGASHSPSDYFSMIGGRRSKIEPADRDPTPTPEQAEEMQEQDIAPNLVSSCLGSDTDSVSTLHGSSPNLSALEGPERAIDNQEQVDSREKGENQDDLIVSLINSPPPPVESDELDEELMKAVIPPPPVSDFDIGVIESLIVPPPSKSPATSSLASPTESPVKVQDTTSSRYSTTVMINLTGGKALGQQIKALEIKVPEEHEDNHSPPTSSPREDTPVKPLLEAVVERTRSPIKTSPRSPAKNQATLIVGEPHPSCSQERSRPQKIISNTMSSSQDSGFSQPDPGDLEQKGSVMVSVTVGEVYDKPEVEQSVGQAGIQCVGQKSEEFLRDKNRSANDTRGSENGSSCKGDECANSKTLQTCSGSVSGCPDNIEADCRTKSSSADPKAENQTSQLSKGQEPHGTKPAPEVPPKPAVRPKMDRQESVDSLTGGDFDTSEPCEKLEAKKTSKNLPVPPPRKRYSPGLAKKTFPNEVDIGVSGDGNSCGFWQSSSLKLNQENGEYLRKIEEQTKPVKRSSSFAPKSPLLHSARISISHDDEDLPPNSCKGDNVNLEPGRVENIETRQTTNVKTVLGQRLSGDIEFKDASEGSRPVMRSNTFSAGSTPELKRIKRQAPPPPPKPIKNKESTSSEGLPLSPKEKQSFKNSLMSSSPSSVAKLLSPKRSFSFLRGPKPFSKSSRADESVLPTSSTEKKESRRPRPLRAFRSLSRKDSYDVSMFDHKRDKATEPTFRECSSLRSVGGLQRPGSLDLSDSTEEYEPASNLSVSHRVSLYETKSKSVDSEYPPTSSHSQLRQSQSLSRASGRPISFPSSTQKYPGPGSIHASLPKRPPPPRPNNPPASPRKAMYPSDDSLSSSSSEVLPSPVPLPSPSGQDQDSNDSDDLSSPPPLPVSMPPVKSRPRALPEHFIPPQSFKSPQSNGRGGTNSDTIDSYTLELESKEYQGKRSVPMALGDVQLLIIELEDCIRAEESASSLMQFRLSKESLISEVREFTSNTKMLVSSAGQSEDQLVRSVNSSMHTLARLCSDAQQTMKAMVSVLQATNLGNKTKEVAINFSNVLSAATEAHGKNLHDPSMQLLLRQAQTMAAILSALMRTLRMLQS